MAEPDSWRQKYFEEQDRQIAQAQGWAAIEELLRRIASRLAIAARGQDAGLDGALGRVVNAMRSPASVEALQPLLSELSAAIARLDEKPGAELPRPVGDCPQELLTRVLDRLVLRSGLQPDAVKLRTRIVARDSSAALPELAAGLADLANRQAIELQQERVEAERTLQQINGRLSEVSCLLGTEAAERRAGHDDDSALSSQLLGHVRELDSNVRQASDLQWLQHRVGSRMEAITGQLQAYRVRSEERHARLEEQSAALRSRVTELEAEGNKLRASLQREQALAMTDALTEIPNRLAYQERICKDYERWRRYGQPLCLATWDVDRFKAINDTYGHQAGDRVLRSVGQHLARSIRRSDFIARYGGEEFVLIIDGVGMDEALKCAEKLREGIQGLRFQHSDKPVPVTISCGLTSFRKGDTLDGVFKRADEALYKAKQSGRNRCVAA